jgi:hypothetical protein
VDVLAICDGSQSLTDLFESIAEAFTPMRSYDDQPFTGTIKP